MAEDNTPTVTARKRKLTPHMRMRLATVQRLKKLGSKGRTRTERLDKLDLEMSDKAKKVSKDELISNEDAPGFQKGKLLSESDEPAPRKDKPPKTVKLNQSDRNGAVHGRLPRVKTNSLQQPPKPKAKFRKRQIHKTWLPTHLFHAKRAHMTPPKEPLWRMAIPLSPTAKCYRPTHRASSTRGAVAWDMSYMSTIGLEGPEKSIQGLFNALGVGADTCDSVRGQKDARWTRGSRSWNGWLYERNGWPTKAIAPATVIWCVQPSIVHGVGIDSNASVIEPKKDKRRAFIRVHPSAFLQLWEELLRLSKVQKPSVTLEDLRFEIGSIEITGPASMDALVGALWPSPVSNDGSSADESPENIWPLLGNVENPASLPANVLLGMDVSDPRLHHPPRMVGQSSNPKSHQRLLSVLSTWPIDTTQPPPRLFDRTARYAATRQLPSQKAINRRKSLASPGSYPSPQSNDPRIPILLLTSLNATGGAQGIWTLLLPWKCTLPTWYALMYQPLNSGGTIRFGGLNERRQIAFERGVPWFPGDFPGTHAGTAWEMQERSKRKEEWEKRPKGKRVEYDSLDLGHDRKKGETGLGWASDWNWLVNGNSSMTEDTKRVYHLPAPVITERLAASKSKTEGLKEALGTVRLTLLTRGVSTICARIYRLPTADLDLRQKWLSLVPSSTNQKLNTERSRAVSSSVARDAPAHVRRQKLAANLLDPPPPLRAGEESYPSVPGDSDVIGFVTTGNFNLGEGRGTALGSILLEKVLEGRSGIGSGLASASKDESYKDRKHEQLCILREAGEKLGRLAKWEVV